MRWLHLLARPHSGKGRAQRLFLGGRSIKKSPDLGVLIGGAIPQKSLCLWPEASSAWYNARAIRELNLRIRLPEIRPGNVKDAADALHMGFLQRFNERESQSIPSSQDEHWGRQEGTIVMNKRVDAPTSKQRGDESLHSKARHGRSDDWQDTPWGSRPRRIPIFPRGILFFGVWRTLRWFLLLLQPLLSSAAAAYLRGRGLSAAIGLFLIGTGFAAVLFVELSSGMTSSNWGTFYRRRGPVEYWIAVGMSVLFYLMFSILGYIG